MKNSVYLDHSATTSLDGRVLTAMLPYLTEVYGNADSVHAVGRRALSGLDHARETVASILDADFNEIYFTSGGTESNNLALRGSFLASSKKRLILSGIEHASVLETANALEKSGATLDYVTTENSGVISLDDLSKKDIESSFLTAVMLVNNETGAIQPIKKACEIVHQNGGLFYTDAVQAITSQKISVKELNVDMLGISAHKFGGPKGVGVLYVKNGVKLSPVITGGKQERLKRGGTSNVAGAIGLAKALEITTQNLEKETLRIKSLRDGFIKALTSKLSGVTLNGDLENLSPAVANLHFDGVDGSALISNLDMAGVYASLGAACSSGSIEPSHVLVEMGLSYEKARSSVRFSFGAQNDTDGVEYAVSEIVKAVEKLRK